MSEELTHKKLKEQNKQIAEQNKEKLDAIKKQFASNLNTLFLNEEEDYKLLEYKGFVVNAYKTKYQVEFSLSPKDNPNIAYSPSNMVYKNDTANMFSSYNFCGEIKFDGFLKRLDNAITKLPEKIKELENSIETTKENISKYTRLVEQKPPYPRLEYLQAVKHPNAKAIGLPRLMLPIGKVWFSLCVPNHRDFTEFDLQRIPYRSHTSYLQRRNFAHFLR